MRFAIKISKLTRK